MNLAAKFSVLALGVSALFANASPPSNRCAAIQKATGQGESKAQFKRYLDAHWKDLMTEFPEWATYEGFPGQNDRLSDRSLPAISRRNEESKCIYGVLKKISRKNLKGEDAVTYDLLAHRFEDSFELAKYGDDYMPVSQLGNPIVDFSELMSSAPAGTVKDFENILKRFDAYPTQLAQVTQVMREGIKRKYMPYKGFMAAIDTQMSKYIDEDPEKTILYGSFKDMPASIPVEDQIRLRARAKEILSAKVIPAIKQFRKFFNEDYAPHGRESIAWTTLPNGAAWYAAEVKHYTTTSKSADELHELGLNEVKRLSAEMTKIREDIHFKGDVKDFNKFLLTDKKFQYASAEELLAGYREIAKRIDAGLPSLFKTLPRLTYGVKEMPPHIGEAGPAAYYNQGSPEAGRAGYFLANTTNLASRPKWAMESLTMHEAVPGHHLQIAIAQELQGLPEQRKREGYTAYIEGWALYAESLGEEIGMYKDPYQKYGNLYYEMLRAVRLVVDTGMHLKGWSKSKALDYYRSQMPAPDKDSENEIDRYITWPGQALAYKVGQLKIRELRNKAKTELGEAFDVREFHDEVLRHGALPMDVLDKTLSTWIASKKEVKNQKT